MAGRRTLWYVVNIKSRGIQTPQRYIEAFEHLNESDPLILLKGNRYISIESLQRSNYLEENGRYSRALFLKLSAYDIINPDAFYNRRSRENVSLQWDPDLTANKKDIEIIFVPSVHKLAFKKSSPISLKSVLKYFSEALKEVEGEGSFDVDVVKSHDIIQRILTSYEIFKVKADISYSNADRSGGFRHLLDDKLRGVNAQRTKILFEGSKYQPLQSGEDGMLEAVVGISENNGSVVAKVRETVNSRVQVINTDKYPLNMEVNTINREDVNTDVYNELKTRFGNNTEIQNEQG